ncbi:MAG: hypothetical protein OEY06_09845 [Gammaproteobacteria bacterium]|nr:hypothetical protein [Gammaproteobacteria bacterium]
MTQHKSGRSIGVWSMSIVAVLFGLMTIRAGGSVLFGDPAAQAAGNYVPFVLWFNFLAGFGYVIAGAGFWLQQRWAVWLAIAIAAATALTFTGFAVHVFGGGDYEQRTVFAMSLRTVMWTALAAIAWRQIGVVKSARI